MLPLSRLRYFPPKFIARDPIAEGVRKAEKDGLESAVISININNLQEISDQLSKAEYEHFILKLKFAFQEVTEREMKDNIIVLQDYYNGLALFIKVKHDIDCVADIENKIRAIIHNADKAFSDANLQKQPNFETGYMFIQTKLFPIHEAIYLAHQQALAMSGKKMQTAFNEMVYSINKIVANKDVRMLAQPIIKLATGEVIAWEMLARGPRGTSLENPLQLFSIARQTGMLYQLELIVFEKILQQISDTGCNQDIFINFTPITLSNQRFITDIKKLMVNYMDVSPAKMIFEITERDSIEAMGDLTANIKGLRKLGFRIAIDDTGAGYASLNSIGEILPDIIKIDRAVIQGIDKNKVKESLLRGLLLVAKEIGSVVVAEGIESREEESVLARNKVDLAQGFLYARPDVLNTMLAVSVK